MTQVEVWNADETLLHRVSVRHAVKMIWRGIALRCRCTSRRRSARTGCRSPCASSATSSSGGSTRRRAPRTPVRACCGGTRGSAATADGSRRRRWTTSCPDPAAGRRPGSTPWRRASPATPARAAVPRTRPACRCAGGRTCRPASSSTSPVPAAPGPDQDRRPATRKGARRMTRNRLNLRTRPLKDRATIRGGAARRPRRPRQESLHGGDRAPMGRRRRDPAVRRRGPGAVLAGHGGRGGARQGHLQPGCPLARSCLAVARERGEWGVWGGELLPRDG